MTEKNYFCYHIHSDLSNAVTNIDSVTKFQSYIDAARQFGMTTFGFSEHGSVMEWLHKKNAIENAGMKYVHAVEAYITEDLSEKVRDNYHCVLIARNYDGFLELNRLISNSFNRNDNHFYYTPRISLKELFETSENIIITTACVGGVYGKGSEELQNTFTEFLIANKHRAFFEIGHHIDEKQKNYNKKLILLSNQTGVPLIAGTDTHALNDEHVEGRKILQKSKNIHFEGEDNWDLTFKSYEQLVEAYKKQNSVPEEVYLRAIDNTNVLADMIEPFEIDRSPKYPHIYANPGQVFREKVKNAIDTHPYALKRHPREVLEQVAEQEIEVFEKTKSVDFMLLQTYLREWEKSHDIHCGFGRGSVSGSMVAYLLGITQMDSIKFNLNFFRFSNPDRVSLADIDTDYAGKDRDRVKEFLLREKLGLDSIRTAEIITFNTIALRGAIRDVCRALYTDRGTGYYISLAEDIISEVENDEAAARKEYADVFKYVDIVNGTIVSIGTHPSGVLVSDLPINETVGLCTISSTEYPVSMINMKELDELMYVKLDILGLDNLNVINETCRLLGIDYMTPDNVDLEDENVWRSIRDDTTLIFQWESNSAQQYLRKFMSDKTLEIAKSKVPNFSMLKWMSFGNGLIRPACASFRDSVAKGVFYDNGFDALNEFLAPEAGRIAMQETIMQFLVKFCGYSAAESDTVRRAIAKKKGTETLLPEIERRFIENCKEVYGMDEEKGESIIKPFIQIILDASAYGFSWNHSDAYSAIGYICGYLRYYHPLEFLTAALNTFEDNLEKTGQIIKYAKKVGVSVTMPKWGISKDDYLCNGERQIIAKGMSSIKYLNGRVASELYELAHSGREFPTFMSLLEAIDKETSLDSQQVDILIGIDFFSDFGNQRELIYIADIFRNILKKGDVKLIKRSRIDGTEFEPIVKKYSVWMTKSGGEAKGYTILDTKSLMTDIENMVKSRHMEDLPDSVKVKKFVEAMGYAGYVTGKEEDRRKLYVTDVKPIKRKKDGKTIGKSVFTKSIGSGKESRFTVWNELYNKNPIQKEDIIWCKSFARNGQYFTLEKYSILD